MSKSKQVHEKKRGKDYYVSKSTAWCYLCLGSHPAAEPCKALEKVRKR